MTAEDAEEVEVSPRYMFLVCRELVTQYEVTVEAESEEEADHRVSLMLIIERPGPLGRGHWRTTEVRRTRPLPRLSNYTEE
jgi:hypothetical protein